jgi:hypothetical protein
MALLEEELLLHLFDEAVPVSSHRSPGIRPLCLRLCYHSVINIPTKWAGYWCRNNQKTGCIPTTWLFEEAIH